MVTQTPSTRDEERRIPMNYADFLAHVPEGIHAEWRDGETVFFMPPTTRHQDIVAFLLVLMRLFAEFRQLGRVLGAPYEMRLVPQQSAREPDILFVGTENLSRMTPKRLEGPADLVVEVISEESVTRDRVDKWREYQMAGVREYWVVDSRPGNEAVEVWGLDPYGRYQSISEDGEGRLHSRVLQGFWLDPSWLQTEDLPQVMHCFVKIVGEEVTGN
jgi:Uma2 family endonuclease